jgi:hypothetical protein
MYFRLSNVCVCDCNLQPDTMEHCLVSVVQVRCSVYVSYVPNSAAEYTTGHIMLFRVHQMILKLSNLLLNEIYNV